MARRAPDHSIGSLYFTLQEAPDFCDPTNQTPHNRQVIQEVENLQPGQLAVLAGRYACMGAVESPKGSFTEIPEFKAGRTASRHGVYFGDLTVETPQNQPIQTFVAVKPYDKRGSVDLKMRPSHAVVHDWSTNAFLNRLSTGSAYDVLGFGRTNDTFFVPQMVTEFQERSKSLDNVFRSKEPDNETREKRTRHALVLGNAGIGIAHGAQITLGDALPQNFATDGSRIIFNDTTTLRPYGKKDRTIPLIEEDVQDFVTGALDPRTSSEETRGISASALRDPEFQRKLYETYLDGARLGARRAGYTPGGLIVPEDTHRTIINEVVAKYGA